MFHEDVPVIKWDSMNHTVWWLCLEVKVHVSFKSCLTIPWFSQLSKHESHKGHVNKNSLMHTKSPMTHRRCQRHDGRKSHWDGNLSSMVWSGLIGKCLSLNTMPKSFSRLKNVYSRWVTIKYFFVDSPNSVTLLTLMTLDVSHRYYVEWNRFRSKT